MKTTLINPCHPRKRFPNESQAYAAMQRMNSNLSKTRFGQVTNVVLCSTCGGYHLHYRPKPNEGETQ